MGRIGLCAAFIDAFDQLFDEGRGVDVANRTPRLAKTVKRSMQKQIRVGCVDHISLDEEFDQLRKDGTKGQPNTGGLLRGKA
jgi:hypothetical protein